MKLPTREQYFNKKILDEVEEDGTDTELYICPLCGKGVKRDYSMIFMSVPPKYRYFCSNRNCEFKEII